MSEKNFGEKIYHIYVRDECIYHCLKEEDFQEKWEVLNRLADLLTDKHDLSYEELTVNRETILRSSY